MTKPIGATQQQLDEHNIEWVLCGGYNIGMNKEPQKWALRHSSEYEWAKERTMLLQEIAELTKDANHLAMCIDTFHADEETYKIMGKYVAHLPKTYKKDIPWPDPLDRSEIKDSKEKLDQNFKDGIRYFQG
jgi:hypothetical protein